MKLNARGGGALSFPRRLPSCVYYSSSSNDNSKQRRPCCPWAIRYEALRRLMNDVIWKSRKRAPGAKSGRHCERNLTQRAGAMPEEVFTEIFRDAR